VEQPKRKHRATGKKPPGGARPGAGRPKGSHNALGYGEVQALRTLRHRVPEGTHPQLADVAGEALEKIVAVMREEVGWQESAGVLKAATLVRQEVCGPMTSKHEVTGEGGGALVVEVREYRDGEGE
jgi:hypothetical protein